MSLPPGFLDDLRARLSLGQVVGRKVIWDARKSNPAKGDLWAPCPFHQEKTASFHVDDRKGFYYCFGCQAKGDAIGFVRETENVGFMEAIEILASEAGMQMPAPDPAARQKADRRGTLCDVMEVAVRYFQRALRSGEGAAARDYLAQGRGLDDTAQDRWTIGYAPDAWQGLWDHLRGKGVSEDLILAAGLARPSTKGGRPYDTFRARIMFPIRDPQGRCVAFGGRATKPGDPAKYLNSPETELFDKSRTLFNLGPARAEAGKGAPLIVAEGYMDVIALSEHGFGASVAGLGTAITAAHLHMLWRVAPEPIVALDGDAAGLRAALRVVDLALPLVAPGQTLRFALMPSGMDPDDLLKARGPSAMRKVLEGALPMVELLWRSETQGRTFDSPERKAGLAQTLRKRISVIPDPGLRGAYDQALRSKQFEMFRARRPAWTPKSRQIAPVQPQTKSSALAGADPGAAVQIRIDVILALLCLRPDMIERFVDRLEALPCTRARDAALRNVLVGGAGLAPDALREKISAALGGEVLENLMNTGHVKVVPGVREACDDETVHLILTETFDILDAEHGLKVEIAEAEQDLADGADEALTWRLAEAARARQSAGRADSAAEPDFEIGQNGARINRAEKDAFEALVRQHMPPKRSGSD